MPPECRLSGSGYQGESIHRQVSRSLSWLGLDLEEAHGAMKEWMKEVVLVMDGEIIKGLLGLLVRSVNYALAIGSEPSSFSVVWEKW